MRMNRLSLSKRSAIFSLVCLLVLLFMGCGRQQPPAEAAAVRLSAAELGARTHYYYQRLSETEQDAYGRIVRLIRSHPEKIEIPYLKNDALLNVFQAISYDNPEILCLDVSCQLITQGEKSYFVPSYHGSVSECAGRTEELLQKAKQIRASAAGKTAYEKELYFHDYLVEHCAYQEEGADWRVYTAAGALLDGKAVCEGYSRAFQLLLDQENIENYLITGTARDQEGRVEGHMWNLVTIDGAPYHVDVTWDDPVGSEWTAPSRAYFNLTDQMIAADHLTMQPEPPGCRATDANYFVKNGLYFTQYGEEADVKIVEAIVQSVEQGRWNLEFCFADQTEYKKAVSELLDGGRIYRLLERANLSVGGRIQTDRVKVLEARNNGLPLISLITFEKG